MASRIFVINGPSLNLLGTREPEVYGQTTLTEIEEMCRARAAARQLELKFFGQTNHEGDLIGWVHDAWAANAAVIINPGAWMTTSAAIADTLKICQEPVIEVHLSNVHRREGFQQGSLISKTAHAVIAGLGHKGYLYAIDALADMASD